MDLVELVSFVIGLGLWKLVPFVDVGCCCLRGGEGGGGEGTGVLCMREGFPSRRV